MNDVGQARLINILVQKYKMQKNRNCRDRDWEKCAEGHCKNVQKDIA